MRVRHLVAAALFLVAAQSVSADPLTAPTASWADGEGRNFELLWSGEQATFSVDGVGTSVYTSLDDCCSDVFDRVRSLNPGSTLTFSQLVLNWGPRIDTVLHDDLDWSLLRASGFDNLISLAGVVTLNVSTSARRGPAVLAFNAPYEEPPDEKQVPEPGILLLVGSGLLGFATLGRRRLARSANPPADPAAR